MKVIAVLNFILLQSLDFDGVFGINISEKKCNDYQKMLPPISGIFNHNDDDAALKEFPFMARIKNATHYGNGILISENFVLTVASSSFKKKVILGDLNSRTRKDDAHSHTLEVIEEFKHPLYSSDVNYNLKLLKLNESVKFNEYIRPACLPQNESAISQQLLEVGWGKTNIRDNGALHKVKLKYISNERCKEEFKFVANAEKFMTIAKGTIFCAMTKVGDRKMSAGSSGASLLKSDRNMFTLSEVIGIVTASVERNHSYDVTVFVPISASLVWIESIVWPDEIVETDSTQTTNEIEITTKLKKVQITTYAATTDKMKIATTDSPPQITSTTNKIKITTSLSTPKKVQRTHAPTTNKIKITSTDSPPPSQTTKTNKIEITTNSSTLKKVQTTTHATTTNKLKITTTGSPPQTTTNKIEITTNLSTPNKVQTTHATTTNKITSTDSPPPSQTTKTNKIEITTNLSTLKKVQTTTHATTTNKLKITTTGSPPQTTTNKIEITTNLSTPKKVQITTNASTTHKMRITTTGPLPPPQTTTTNKIEITTESLTNELTTKLPFSEKNFFNLTNILMIIIAATSLSLLLCVAFACFQMKRTRNRQNVEVNIQFQS